MKVAKIKFDLYGGITCKTHSNVRVFNLSEDQPKGTCKKPSAVELGASGVRNRSLSRLFAQVELPRSVLIAPPEFLYVWIGPRLKDIGGTLQGTFYDSFDAAKSTIFRDRVRQPDVRLALSRLVGRSVAITSNVVWPSPVTTGCKAVTAYWGLTLAMGYPESVDDVYTTDATIRCNHYWT
ncbi:unnamed protein product [Allacma fusca]|uniref:Uncharacterized protein n=1 Tax=Allacma fusca TaxID=39272 RepID=A0A8J2JA62_9HEXA|nr:unnamed protein product [Allacma fusca]